jgi:outer membrane protein OmpA-like peptidoglycan-associated protein
VGFRHISRQHSQSFFELIEGVQMIRFSKHLVAASALALIANGASAQNIQGFYLGGGVGGFYQFEDEGGVGNTKYTQEWSYGAVGLLSLGYGFGNGLRAEIEGALRGSDVDSAKLNDKAANGSGRSQSYAVMANVVYDLDLRLIGIDTSAVVPYFGAGIGYHNGSFDGTKISNSTTMITSDDNDGRMAYQFFGGLAFPIASVPGLALTTEVRYFNDDHGPELKMVNTTGGASTSRVQRSEFANISVLLGLRYAFNAAPVVAAAAPVAAARTFLVFFDWSKADLTDRARQIIGEAASARGQGVTRIEVNGFTDRSGSAEYNLGLSQRRANAVAAELVRRGVPRNEIVTRGFGEENNLVPTADGVREPQNRRVEIILK